MRSGPSWKSAYFVRKALRLYYLPSDAQSTSSRVARSIALSPLTSTSRSEEQSSEQRLINIVNQLYYLGTSSQNAVASLLTVHGEKCRESQALIYDVNQSLPCCLYSELQDESAMLRAT